MHVTVCIYDRLLRGFKSRDVVYVIVKINLKKEEKQI